MVKFDFDPDRDIGDLSGKVIFVTGGTAGIGQETVLQLAKHSPARIYFSGRNEKSAEAVVARVRETGSTTPLSFVRCDLSSLASVKAAAEGFLAGTSSTSSPGPDGSPNGASDAAAAATPPERLDLLVANAGKKGEEIGLTEDGYELTFGTNHVGHALLIRKLLPLMERTAAAAGGKEADVRVVVLTSLAYEWSPGLDWDHLRKPKRMPLAGPWIRYGQSKLANLLYARALAKRFPSSFTTPFRMTFQRVLISAGAVIRGWPTLTPEQGAYSQLWLSTAPRDLIKTGELYEPVGVLSRLRSAAAGDESLADELWDWTETELKPWV